ncbi:hypothetical protein Tco_0478120 [Tanacetum coccineum]
MLSGMQTVNNEEQSEALPRHRTERSIYEILHRQPKNHNESTSVPFTLLHCSEVLKECDQQNSREVPLFMQEREEKKNKRYKSSGSSSFNTKKDQATRKMKAGSAGSSAISFDVEALAKMMASEYELELKAAELEIRRMKNRQRDKALYETTTDEELKAGLRQRLFG